MNKHALRVERLPGQGGLRVTGEVDLTTRGVWQHALATLVANGNSGRLDLSGLSFIDVRGTEELMAAARRKQLVLYRPPPCLRRVLDMFWPGALPTIVIEPEAAR